MDLTDWIIRAAIFGVLAAVLIGTFQNLYDAIKKRGKK
jgi:Flp pilus assembly pilin Flp